MSESQPPGEYFCPQCKYDLRSVSEPRCPECGFRFDWRALRLINAEWYDARLADFQEAFLFGTVAAVAVLIFRVVPLFGFTTSDVFARRLFLYAGVFLGGSLVSGHLGRWLRFPHTDHWADSESLKLALRLLAAAGIGVLVYVKSSTFFWVSLPGLPAAYGFLTLREFRRNRACLDVPSMDEPSRRRIVRWSRAVLCISLLTALAAIAEIVL